jgi:uncharacterized membrane protein YfcA
MTVAVVGVSVLAAACVQASTGLGFALVLAPILFALLSPAGAIVMVTGLGLILNALVLGAERRRPHVAWGEAIPLVAAAIPGTVCGVLVLRLLSKPVLQVGVGLILVAAALMRMRAGRAAAPGGGVGPARLAVGFATGALTTSTGVSGPPLAMWLARRGLAPAELRDSLSAMFLALGASACVALVPVLGRSHLDPRLLAAGAACVVGGHALGRRVFARLGPRRFETLLYLVIAGAGIASLSAGLLGA